MSGMFDTKTDKVQRKLELTQKEQKERRKRNIITVSVTVLFLLAVAVSVLVNSNWLRRTAPVVTVNGINFSAAEFEYFFNSEYMRIAQEYESMGWEFFLPDPNRSLARQENPMTGEPWADFITENALGTMQELSVVYNAAKAAEYELTQERKDAIESEVGMYDFYAQISGYPTTESYLQLMFGPGMNEQILRDMLEFSAIAEDYVMHVRDSFTYTDEQIDEYYAQNADTLDFFKYRIFFINPDTAEVVAESPDAEAEEAGAAALETAANIAAGIDSEESFLLAAQEYDGMYADPMSTLRELQGERLDEPEHAGYSGWLRDSARAAGDVEAIEYYEGAAILYFIGREDNNYRTVGMRQILILRGSVSPEDYTEGEDDPGYKQAVADAADEARERAELVDSLFTEAGRTEQALLDLLEEHSDEDTEGGYYDNISKDTYQGAAVYAMKVVPELEEWLFDDGRAEGDSLLIETEAYGYHLLYFTGYGEILSRLIGEDKMRVDDIMQWLDDLPTGEPVKHRMFIIVNT